MTSERARPPRNVPTLTEVVGWAEPVSRETVDTIRDPGFGRAEAALPDRLGQAMPQPLGEPESIPRRDPAEPPPLPERDPPVGPEPQDEPPPVGEEGPKPPPVHAAMRLPLAGPEWPAGSEAVGLSRPLFDQEAMRGELLLVLQRQIDLGLEERVREVLTPILVRATDAVVREARSELALTVRDLVAQSVAQELLRQRSP